MTTNSQNASEKQYWVKCAECKKKTVAIRKEGAAGIADGLVCKNCGEYPGVVSSYGDCPHNPVCMWKDRGKCIAETAQARKRVKEVYTSSEIPHLWYHKVQHTARNSTRNLYFEGDTIYSYGSHFPIARHVQKGKRSAVLFTIESYSVTTTGHCSMVRSAIPESALVFSVPDVNVTKYHSEEDHKKNLAYYLSSVEHDISRCARARSSWKKKSSRERAIELSKECREYCKFFQVKTPKLPRVPALDSAEIKKIKQRESKRAAEKAEETRKQREEQARLDATRIERWRNGEFVSNLYNVPVMLRLSADKTEVETSQGVKVPASHALRALRFVRAVVAKGEEYRQNGHTFHIGHYTINRIEANGTLHAGRHVISLEEIERFAPSLVKPKMFALVSNQGTAMPETALTEAEYNNPQTRKANEKNPPKDAKLPLEWHDVTENEAIVPEED